MTRHEFRLADIGEGLEDAEIVQWFVSVGDQVRRDQPLVEVMTDKSNAELPAPEQGTVVELGGGIGDIITVGELVAVIETEPATEPAAAPGAAPPAAAPAAGALPTADAPAATQASLAGAAPLATGTAPAPRAPTSRPKASPSTRRVAADRSIDLTTIRGTGPGGRILLADLDTAPATPSTETPSRTAIASATALPITGSPSTETPSQTAAAAADSWPTSLSASPAVTPSSAVAASSAVTSSPAPPMIEAESVDGSTVAVPTISGSGDTPASGTVPLRGVRRAVARNMAQSWSEIPHIHAFDEIDAEPLLELRSHLRATAKPAFESITPLTFLVAAVAKALRLHPQANASINVAEATITRHSGVNVGVAVASEQGLVVPVLRGADRLDFETLSLTLTELVRAARAGALGPEHFRGGTVTITNFGALGGQQATPLIRPPEACIFGFGAIAARPFVIDGQVVARKTMPTVVGADHRLLDGDITTAVLTAVGSALAAPLELVL